MFDPWLVCRHPVVVALGGDLLRRYEGLAPPRKRAMKAQDRANLETALRGLLANVAYAIATNAVPLSIGVRIRAAKQRLTRYDRKGLANLPAVLETLDGAGLLDLRKSTEKGTASAVIPGPDIMAALRGLAFGPEHFEQAPGREVICLARTERDFVDGTTTRELIDYRDTQQTTRYRGEVETINRFLASADLGMAPDGGPLVMTSVRECRRHFSVPPEAQGEPFGYGGRLFGGWWQELPKSRRHAIRIAGEPVADLDFTSMFLRLAYLEAGAVAPESDLYATVPGLAEPRWRQGVKKVTSAMLFRRSPLTRLPRGLKGLLPDGITGAEAREAIRSAHPALVSVFETGIGLRLMFTESQILIAALLRLVAKGIPGLGMHDGLMVARSKIDEAKAAMSEASAEVVGVALPVVLKGC